MSHKILVADDSATIQKVVSITLANERCELVEAENTESLFQKLITEKYSLILLDFNLSDKHSGYELAKMIKEKSPKTKIIAMLGTFDTVDDDKITECGIEELVVKPFESNKFIQSCRKLISDVAIDEHVEDLNNHKNESDDNEISLSLDTENDPASGWITNTPDIENNVDILPTADQIMTNVPNLEAITTNDNSLAQELEGWGMEVPSVINEGIADSSNSLFPPLMETETFSFEKENNEQSVSSNLMFQSVDDLNVEEEEEINHPNQDRTVEIEIEQFDLEKEIEEEDNPESFWAVDEGDDPLSAEENMSLGVSVKVSTPEYLDVTEELAAVSGVGSLSDQDKQDIIEALTLKIRPIIEETVRELCVSEVNKVAWEVIPDLAENLISKEIKELAESIQ